MYYPFGITSTRIHTHKHTHIHTHTHTHTHTRTHTHTKSERERERKRERKRICGAPDILLSRAMVQFGMWGIWRQRATATKMADIPVITSPFSPHEYAWPSIIETQTETHTNTHSDT